jgi:kinetochore protein Nuf2
LLTLLAVFLDQVENNFQLTHQDFQETPPEVMERLHNLNLSAEEIAEHSFSEIRFFVLLRDWMVHCGLPDFSWRDLYMPTAFRFRAQLSAAINYTLYLNEKMEIYNEMLKPRGLIVAARAEVEAEHDKLLTELKDACIQSADKNATLNQLVGECQQLELEIARYTKNQGAIRKETEEKRKSIAEMQDNLATIQWTLQELDVEEQELRSQLVSSPDRRKQQLEQALQELDNEKDQVAALEKQLQESKTKVAFATEAKKDLLAILGDITAIKDMHEKYLKEKREKEAAAKKVAEKEHKIKMMKEECAAVRREIQHEEDMRRQEKLSHGNAMKAIDGRKAAARARLQSLHKAKKEQNAKLQEAENKEKQLQLQIEKENAQHQVDMKYLTEEYDGVVNKFKAKYEKYHILMSRRDGRPL